MFVFHLFEINSFLIHLMYLDSEWKIPGLKACLQLAWSLTLRTLAVIPNAVTEPAVETLSSPEFTEVLEQDERLLEMALAGKAFQFLKVIQK